MEQQIIPLQHAAKALIRRKTDGKYLMLWSSVWEENPRRSQQPDLPGGVVESGETMHEGLCRELVEEIGLDVARFETTLGYAFTYENDKTISIFQCYLVVVDDDPEIKLSWEHEKYAWLTAEEVLALEIRQPYPTIFESMAKTGLLV